MLAFIAFMPIATSIVASIVATRLSSKEGNSSVKTYKVEKKMFYQSSILAFMFFTTSIILSTFEFPWYISIGAIIVMGLVTIWICHKIYKLK